MSKRVMIGTVDEFEVGKLRTVNAEGTTVVVARNEAGFCAVQNRCAHLPLPISAGKYDGETITCPWHNSAFDACTGENKDWTPGVAGVSMPQWSRSLLAMGRKPAPLTTYPITEEDGKLYVEI